MRHAQRVQRLWVVFSVCAIALGLVNASVATVVANSAIHTVLGTAEDGNNSTWSDDRVAWTWSDDEEGDVLVWDGRVAEVSQIEYMSGAWPVDAFWHGERLIWLRRDRLEVVESSAPWRTSSVVVSRRGSRDMAHLVRVHDLVAWVEQAAASDSWRIMAAGLTDGHLKSVSRISSGFIDMVASDEMLAWVELGEGGVRPAHRIHVRLIGETGVLQATDTELAVSPDSSESYGPGSLGINGNRLAWVTNRGIVRTWAIGDSSSTQVSEPPPQSVEIPAANRPSVWGETVAWLSTMPDGTQSILCWEAGEGATTVLDQSVSGALSDPVAAEGRVVWAVAGSDSSGTIVVWSRTTKCQKQIPAPGLTNAYVADLGVAGVRVTYCTEGEGEGYDVLHLVSLAGPATEQATSTNSKAGEGRRQPREPLIWALAGLIVAAGAGLTIVVTQHRKH